MYKMVTGSVDELEGKLNEAAAAGFTEVAREFSSYETAPFQLDAEGLPLRPTLEHRPTYSYLMRKPRSPADEVAPIIDALRDMARSLGIPMPSAATLGKLIKLDGGREEPKPTTP